MPATALPYAHLGDALATDYFRVREQLTEEQWDYFTRVRSFAWTARCCLRSTSTGRPPSSPGR